MSDKLDPVMEIDFDQASSRRCRNVYAAGKISRMDWRLRWVDPEMSDSLETIWQDGWPSTPIPGIPFRYVGPYFIGCDHGCAHGDNQHAMLNQCMDSFDEDNRAQQWRMVRDLCLQAIRKCDVFYAWIDCKDCYGTLAEIGFARGLGKRIWLGLDHNFNWEDLWFAVSTADRLCVAADPIKAFLGLAQDNI